jgi:hypothetical protein
MKFKDVFKQTSVGKLLALRWMGQFTDGVFQSALASFVYSHQSANQMQNLPLLPSLLYYFLTR